MVLCVRASEMGEACSLNGGEENYIQGFGGLNLKERAHLEDLGVDARIILKFILNEWD